MTVALWKRMTENALHLLTLMNAASCQVASINNTAQFYFFSMQSEISCYKFEAVSTTPSYAFILFLTHKYKLEADGERCVWLRLTYDSL